MVRNTYSRKCIVCVVLVLVFGLLLGLLLYAILVDGDDPAANIAIFETVCFVEMGPKQVKEYETFLARQSVKQLEKELAGQRSFQRMRKVLWELAKRPNTDAIRILKEFQSKVSGKDPAIWLVRAEVLVAIARAETTGDDTAYIKRLEQILSRKTKGELVDCAAYRLQSLGTKEARNALLRTERGNRPSVKIGRLLLDYGSLGDEEFVQAILASVRQVFQEYKAKTVPVRALVAERSVLAWRRNPVIPLIEKELTYLRWVSSQPSDEFHRKYVRFLKSLLGDLKRARAGREGVRTRPTTTTAPVSQPAPEEVNKDIVTTATALPARGIGGPDFYPEYFAFPQAAFPLTCRV